MRDASIKDLKRILITRTDRMGDVVLSTPAIQALREAYPRAYIAMMVSPYTREIVEGNPCLDEIIILDKKKEHKSIGGIVKLAVSLKRKKFDAAFILHPETRANLIVFLAGIPRRIGYDRKSGFLLTDRFLHHKHRGQKHEIEYTLDLLRYMGIDHAKPRLHVPVRIESEQWAEQFLQEQDIGPRDAILAVHPSSSCISRKWPLERFAEAADRLSKKYAMKVMVIAAASDTAAADELVKMMRCKAVNAAGRTTISQMASLLKRAALFISNDSGPVHVAAAVGTPVISLFGRNQRGISPRRWRPVGEKSMFLHKNIGCAQCLAHNCVKGFACLKAISVDEVVQAAEKILAIR